MESGTQTNLKKKNVFEAFYEDYLVYKGYFNDIFNTLIPKDDILRRMEKETTAEYSKKIKSLQNQTGYLKKKSEVLKEY